MTNSSQSTFIKTAKLFLNKFRKDSCDGKKLDEGSDQQIRDFMLCAGDQNQSYHRMLFSSSNKIYTISENCVSTTDESQVVKINVIS